MRILCQSLHVVPANAGTHTLRQISIALKPTPEFSRKRLCLSVPAFAGTTNENTSHTTEYRT